MVDVSPVSLRRTPDTTCYLPFPFVGEFSLPNSSRVIPDMSVDIIPFVYPLVDYESISKYLKSSSRPGQLHYEVAKSIQLGQRD